MTLQTEAAEILREAAQVVEKRGHHKGAYVNRETGAVCLWGAIYSAAGMFEADTAMWRLREDPPALVALTKYFDRQRHGMSFNVVPGSTGWNDDPSRTREDVIKFLLTTADKIEVSDEC